jgi:hypothetical protein
VKRKLKKPRTGITVTGQKTVFPPIRDIPVPTADNIIKEEVEELTFYKAACDGALRVENQVMSVFPTLEVNKKGTGQKGLPDRWTTDGFFCKAFAWPLFP